MLLFRDFLVVIGGVAQTLLAKVNKVLQQQMPRRCARDRQSSFPSFPHYRCLLLVCQLSVNSRWRVGRSREVGSRDRKSVV